MVLVINGKRYTNIENDLDKLETLLKNTMEQYLPTQLRQRSAVMNYFKYEKSENIESLDDSMNYLDFDSSVLKVEISGNTVKNYKSLEYEYPSKLKSAYMDIQSNIIKARDSIRFRFNTTLHMKDIRFKINTKTVVKITTRDRRV